MLDLEGLRALVAVVDAGGFTAASRRLALSQSAVSQQIRRLEAAAGRRLLIRERSGVAPTDSGEVLLGYARRILALHDEALQTLQGAATTGRVRLATPDDYAAVFLPAIISRFSAAFPGVQLEIRCAVSGIIQEELEARLHDIALVTRRPGSRAGTFVRNEPLVWAAAAGHRPETLDPLPLALFPEGDLFRPIALEALDRAGRPWRIAFLSASLAAIIGAVASGLAVTCLARSTVPEGWRLLGEAEGFPRLPAVELAMLTGPRPSRAVRLLARHLLDALAEPASAGTEGPRSA